MNGDAVYATAGAGPLGRDAQKNLTLEFSRRARGIPVWAALRTLGRSGVAALVDRHRAQARRLADGLRAAGFEVVNRVVLNQVLARCATDDATLRARADALASGELWFGATVWQGRPAFRLSVSSWRTTDADVDAAVARIAATAAR
jgi:aromatic-L-amino-acid decarboxylase